MTEVAAPNTNTRKAADVTLGKREQVAAGLPWERLRDEATSARRDSTEHLDELVALFTRNAQAAGIKVVRATDNAGNTSYRVGTVTVPKNQKRKSQAEL